MPRESHLLPEHSQQLLRAARRGCAYKPPAPPEEDKDPLDEDEDNKELPQGFTVKKWVKVPRHLEEPEPEYLAKRRKGLPSQYSVDDQALALAPVLRETKIQKMDAEGNVSVYKVLVPEGQAVEGEIQGDGNTETAPVAATPGTVVAGVGVVNSEGVVVANEALQAPMRRKPPPKKKRKSGPGRGKKKVAFVEGALEQGIPTVGAASDRLVVPVVKREEGSVEPSDGGDTPMPDAGDDEEGSGEEGSDDEDQDEDAHSVTPAQGPQSSQPLKSETSTQPANVPGTEPPVEVSVESIPAIEPALPQQIPAAILESTAIATHPLSAPAAQLPVGIKEEEPPVDSSTPPGMPPLDNGQSFFNQVSSIPATGASVESTVVEPSVPHPPAPEPAPEPAASDITTETLVPTLVSDETAAASAQPVAAISPEKPAPIEDVQASNGETDILGSLERQLEKDSSEYMTES